MDPNQKLTGITQMAPPSMMGGGSPMGGTPPMGGGSPMGGKPPMGPATPPPLPMSPPMGEPEMNPQQDAAMLAEAVVDKTRGNVEAAINLLDTSKAMLMSAVGGQEQPIAAAYGKPLMRNMGGPLYRENGGTMSEADILRQMIMEGLGQSGRGMSDRDMLGRTMSDRDMSGRTMSNKGQSDSTSKAMDELNKFRYGG